MTTSLLKMATVAMQNHFSSQTLARMPEPDQVMDAEENVDQFNEILHSNVAISFCGAIELLFEIGALPRARTVLDLGCGPGHFSLFMVKYGGIEKLVGIDLSEPMLEKAKRNAEHMGLSHRVEFVRGDMTHLPQFADGQFDLVTCTNASHHLPNIQALQAMLREMTRVVNEQGTAFVMDLTRLKTSSCVQKYVKMMGAEYLENDLETLYQDFYNSMHAAWTPDEMRSAVTPAKSHQWHHFAMSPLPANQFLFAKARSWPTSAPRADFRWPDSMPPVRSDLQVDYKRYRQALFSSYKSRTKHLG